MSSKRVDEMERTARPGVKPRNRGASLTSYGLVVGLISIVALAAVTGIGSNVDSLFNTVGGELGDVVDAQAAAQAGPTAAPTATAGGCTPDSADLSFDETSSGTYTLTVDADEIDCTFSFEVDGAAGGCGGHASVCQRGGNGGRNAFSFIPGEVGDFEIVVGGGGGAGVEETTGGGGGGASSVGFTPTSTGTYFTLSIAGGGGGGADNLDIGGDGAGNGTGTNGSGGAGNMTAGGSGLGGNGSSSGVTGLDGADCPLPCRGGAGGNGLGDSNGGFGVGAGTGANNNGSGTQDGGGSGGGYGGGGSGAVNSQGTGGGGIVVTGNGAFNATASTGGAANAPTQGGSIVAGSDGRVRIISITP